ncbi:MAG: dihydrodipicolinate synthase family protein [bacterium]|nr:dihydrodipicolinate synthase family protein [bacterium]
MQVLPGRTITGMSAILLPHLDSTTVDWASLDTHIARTHEAGLTPAVNMDTGYVQLLDPDTRVQVLDRAEAITGGEFVAGAFVADDLGAEFDLDAYLRAAYEITARGGLPVIFPSHGLTDHGDAAWLDAHGQLAGQLERFIGFELGPMFVPYGRIVSLDTYQGLVEIPQCIGAKHSSLNRQMEWDRLAVRNEVRPDFMVLTGNDLAIDMVMYGSDYLLGLSTFAPDKFAERDRLWAKDDPGFHQLNDVLQYLGHFTFRPPVPAYRHSAAMFLQMRGWTEGDAIPAGAPMRPDSDREILRDIGEQLGVL